MTNYEKHRILCKFGSRLSRKKAMNERECYLLMVPSKTSVCHLQNVLAILWDH